jgi:hypothetical protein
VLLMSSGLCLEALFGNAHVEEWSESKT